jgi:hypothetical protein
LSDRVQHDLEYKNGQWNVARYNSDPYTAYPNASSPFPLYVMTKDGFVIERSHPISGLLDTSQFDQLLKFSEPEFIDTPTNERWRIFAKPIIRENKTWGVIAVSIYHPAEESLAQVDQKLHDNADLIDQQLEVHNNDIDGSKLDVRNIHYDVSFEVVNDFNKVIINEGRTPTFIDKSYVKTELTMPGTRVIQDSVSKEEFLVYSQPFFDEEKNSVGVITVAKSLSSINVVLQKFLFFIFIIDLVALVPACVFWWKLKDMSDPESVLAKPPKFVAFDKKTSVLTVNKNEISIPYASNQYEICTALFSLPQKKWEADELLEKFGEEINKDSNRKIYDAMLAVNKKVGFQLIVYQDKRYSLSLIPSA